MKVAVLLSGQIRDGIEVFDGVKNFLLTDLSPDVYIHSYNCEKSEQILNLYNPKKYVLENQKEVDLGKDPSKYTHKAGETNVSNCLNMWRKRKLNFELIANDYDIVYVSRLDCYCNNTPLKDFLIQETLNIPERGNFGGILDIMAWGSYENMKYYTSLYDKIDDYYNDGHGVRFHPETLLAHHLRQNPSIKINRVPVKITLRNHVFNNHG